MSITIDTTYCKGCELCLVVCKPEALTQGSERNTKGYLTPFVNQEACVACRNCELVCPEMAITVEED